QIARQAAHRLQVSFLDHVRGANPRPQLRVKAQLDETPQIGLVPREKLVEGRGLARLDLLKKTLGVGTILLHSILYITNSRVEKSVTAWWKKKKKIPVSVKGLIHGCASRHAAGLQAGASPLYDWSLSKIERVGVRY